jgi:methylphosphotriester-DNA--protein-cysteine methyltransferase
VLYRRYVPKPPLNDFVEYMWYYKGFFPDHSLERVVPDGSIELLIDLAGPAKKLYSDVAAGTHREFRRAWISGQHSRFIVIGAEQNSSMMGIHFRPGGAYPFLPFPVSELNDEVVDMELVWGRPIRGVIQQILEAGAISQKFRILERALWSAGKRALSADQTCAYALARLREAKPGLTIRRLSSEIGFSQRQLLRHFQQRVGLSPKALARVFRFQSVLHRLNTERRVHWAHVASDAGYFDQSHFVRDFRQFTGLNPSRYLLDDADYGNFIPIR